MVNKFKKFILLWPEIYSVPLALLGFYVFTPYCADFWLKIDPTYAPIDLGVLVKYAIAVLGVLLFSGLVFLGIKLNWFGLYSQYKQFPTLLNQLTAWQKVITLLVVFFGLLYAFVLLM